MYWETLRHTKTCSDIIDPYKVITRHIRKSAKPLHIQPWYFFCNFYFLVLQTMLQFFKLNIYLIKSLENTHIWLQLVMEFQIGELLEEHQKYNRNTNTHTHTTYAHTQNRKDSQLHKLFKKAPMPHKHLFALKGVLIFCWVISTLHNSKAFEHLLQLGW